MLCELVWVLRGAYGYKKSLVVKVLEHILATSEFEIEDSNTAGSALAAYRRGSADFSDYVIIRKNSAYGCKATYSFDRKLTKYHSVLTP